MRSIRPLARSGFAHTLCPGSCRWFVCPVWAMLLVFAVLPFSPPAGAQPTEPGSEPHSEPERAAAQPQPPASMNALKPERRRELQHLLDDLRDPDLELERRRRAAAILLHREWPAAVQSLRRLLIGGAHPSTLRAIAQAVAEHEAPDAQLVPALLKLLKREETELRRDVAAALGRFDSDKLRRQLIDLATDSQNPTPLRLGAIRALAEHRTQPVAKALLEVAESGGPAERQSAFEALAQLTGLQELGEDLEAWRRWWSRARERSERRWRTMLMRNLSARNAEMMERLRGGRERVVEAHSQLYNATAESDRPEMIAQLLEDPMAELRLLALKLIDRRLLNAQPISDSVRQAMRRRLTDQSAEVRGRTAQLLENLADARGARIASGLLLAETDVQVQARFLSLLARVPQAEAVEPALLLMDRSALRGPAASLLVEADRADLLRPDQARRGLEAARAHIETADQPEPAMLRLLGRLGESSDRSLLVDRLNHEASAVRLAAGEALAAEQKWPLDPLLDHLDDPALRSLVLQAIVRCGADAEVIERLLAHEPESPKQRSEWLEAVRAVAARLDQEGVRRVDRLLAERSGSDDLHERVLRAAAGLDEEDQPEAEGRRQDSADAAAWVEAALCLSELYMDDGRLDRAERVCGQVRQEAPTEMLAEQQRHRLALVWLKVLLARGQPIAAAEHTEKALEAGVAMSVEALARCWLDAVRAAREAERITAARELAQRTRDLFEGQGAAEPVLSSEALRQTLESAESSP